MASTSNRKFIVDDDDDDFDWEAAVKEIDVACLSGIHSASSRSLHSSLLASPDASAENPASFPSPEENEKRGTSRQSTLHRFIINPNAKSQKKTPEVEEPVQDRALVEDSVCLVDIDQEAAKTWIYPVNVPLRDYQLAITKTALFSNTLVALPTGLGKTLIAAVVMYNYFRWFPEGKIVFTAPSRPLVLQQIEACHNIVGIPQEWTIDMTGLINPTKRACFWKSKRVFFVTPQVLEKDIQSGTCLVKYLVCLVIDEAHRALGNYSYCVAIRELMMVPVPLRILALTATPGSKKQGIQQIIDNLHISNLQYRDESDHDVSPYVHDRKIELIQVAMGEDAFEINNKLLEAIRPFVAKLCSMGVLQDRDYRTLSPCDLLNSRDKFRQAPPSVHPHIKYQDVEGYFGVLITLYHIRKLLSSHGIRPASEMLEEKLQRGDIMGALAKIEDIVRATEFIGQSSGKSLKGQSQKVQQAVLEKFRAGGYNVIVATCIGEEGLDIMEVDLVICFDANISPIRMIQRMGRTGRKHDGRGYMRKQTTSKSIKKHMQNGGINSFNFHASPRMIPHTIKPEVQFVKLSIKQFVRPGKKVKDEHAVQITSFKNKLTNTETELLLKYFHPCEDAWKPSIIAFPHFQTFPSRTHGVRHSSSINEISAPKTELEGPIVYPKVSAPPNPTENNCSSVYCSLKHPSNIGSGFVSVDAMGEDQISRFPVFSSKEILHSNSVDACSKILLSSPELGSWRVRTSLDLIVRTEAVDEPTTSQTKFLQNEVLPSPETDDATVLEDKAVNQIEKIHQSTVLKRTFFNEGDNTDEKPVVLEIEPQFPPADECSIIETQLSPRLTNLIESGFVPDSPIDECGYSRQRIYESAISQFILPVQVDGEQLLKSSSPGINKRINCNEGSHAGNDVFLASGEDRPSVLEDNDSVGVKSHAFTSPVAEETQTPFAIIASSCDNEDWNLVSGEKASSVQKPRKFKRLRKVGDVEKNENTESAEKTSVSPLANMVGTFSSSRHIKKKKRDGERRFEDNVRAYIEEEAEVSSDATISGDEEDDKIKSSFDSFIDDRVSASATSTQDETGGHDMMAIYRRSLLSQSPFGRLTSPLATRVTESETSPDKTLNVFQTTLTGNVDQSHTMHSEHVKMKRSPEVVISTTGGCPSATEVESRNRNLTFCASESVPKLNLDRQFELVVAGRESISDVDDEFYEGLDLDAVEAQAKLLLEKKVELPQMMVTQPHKNLDLHTSPSFDLGI
ncbi:DEAD-box ATP-dependent RNA helicase FANCM, partial [Cucurbita argyrosperma subsp. argyrosperma]